MCAFNFCTAKGNGSNSSSYPSCMKVSISPRILNTMNVINCFYFCQFDQQEKVFHFILCIWLLVKLSFLLLANCIFYELSNHILGSLVSWLFDIFFVRLHLSSSFFISVIKKSPLATCGCLSYFKLNKIYHSVSLSH